MFVLFAVCIRGIMGENNGAGDDVVTTTNSTAYPVKDAASASNGKEGATENTSLSPNAKQTYFADARIRIPDDEDVSVERSADYIIMYINFDESI